MKRTPPPNMDRIEDLLKKALDEGRRSLLEHEIYEVLALMGFRVPRASFVSSEGELRALDLDAVPGKEVVCKLISPTMPHRSEFGGIKFVKRTRKDLAAAFHEFERIARKTRSPLSGMMIAEKIAGEDSVPHQLLVSMRQDPSFGPVVFCGLGGVGTEVYAKGLRREKALLIRAASDAVDREGTRSALERTFFYSIVAGATRITSAPLVDTERLIDAWPPSRTSDGGSPPSRRHPP